MKRRLGVALGGIGLVTLMALVLTASAAAAPTEQATPSPAQLAAQEYLEARSQAVLAAPSAPDLTDVLAGDKSTLARERLVVRGKLSCWQTLDERVTAVDANLTVESVEVDDAAGTATVQAYVYTTVTLRSVRGGRQEGEGIDHVVTLRCLDGQWQVVDDQYLDTAQPSYLRAAGASTACVRRAAQKLADAADARRLAGAVCPVLPGASAADRAPAAAASGRSITRLTYDRANAVRYADRWTSESDSTGISHNGARYNPNYYDYASNGGPGDCTPYASQCIRAGGYPFLRGWYYDFGNPFKASPSWYNNNPQRTYLKGRYFDRVDSVSDLKKGDLIYYDWNADGYLDHTAVYVGIYDGVRCVDAHTSDHRHHWWKLSAGSTKFYFFSMRDSIIWPLPSQ